MSLGIDHDVLDDALKRCGATWDAAQAHGLLSGRLSIAGADAGFDWLSQVLEGTDDADALRAECEDMLSTLFESTYRQLSERQSAFEPLLPGDQDTTSTRTEALARWCEGFLHGLVAKQNGDALKERLAAEPLADIIKDMLQMTRAMVEDDGDDESDEEAYAELVEYLRAATQLAYEELADLRRPAEDDTDEHDPEVLH
jgi:yecA family protein